MRKRKLSQTLIIGIFVTMVGGDWLRTFKLIEEAKIVAQICGIDNIGLLLSGVPFKDGIQAQEKALRKRCLTFGIPSSTLTP